MKYVKRLTAILLCLTLVLSFASCTGGQKTPKDAVTATMEALKAGKLLTVKRNVVWDDMELLQSGMSKIKKSGDLLDAMFNKLTYEIKGEAKIDGDTATIPVSITTKDIKSILTSFMITTVVGALTNKQVITDDTLEQEIPKLVEQMNAADVKTTTKEVTVKLVKVKNKWKVDVDSSLASAITGGSYNTIKMLVKRISGVTEGTTTTTTTKAQPQTTGAPVTVDPKAQEEASRKLASQFAVLSSIADEQQKNQKK